MIAFKNILHCLKDTLDLALFYLNRDDQPLISFADSNYKVQNTRRSTSRIIHKLEEAIID